MADDAGGRVLLLPVDDSDDSQRAAQWLVQNMLKPEDEVHICHVIPRLVITAMYGAPQVDFLPQQDPKVYDAMISKTEEFVSTRFVPLIEGAGVEPIVHIIKSEVDSDSIGHVICKKAESLNAAAVVMAKHNRGAIKEFFMGSVSKHVSSHCTHTVVIVH